MKVRFFVIHGDPVAQGRPKFSKRGGFARAYDPAKSREYKRRTHAHIEAQGFERIDDGPIAVSIDAYFRRPQSRKGSAVERHTVRPDAENVAKIILDAANEIAWRDDSQVSQLRVRKFVARPGDSPRVEVRFMPIDIEVNP